MGFFSKKKSISDPTPAETTDPPASSTEAPKIEGPVTDAEPIAPSEDPFASQRTADDDPFAKHKTEEEALAPVGSVESGSGSPVGIRRTSKEWDASKVPPSQFQKRKGSLYATPNSRDSHHESTERDKAYFDKLKEKGWGVLGKSK